MKKNLWIIIVAIVAIISLMVVFVGCDKKIEPTTPDVTPDEGLTATTFFSAAAGVSNPNVVISLISDIDGEDVEIYSRSSKGVETNPYNIDTTVVPSTENAANLSYREGLFSTTQIIGTKLVAKVTTPKEYLGITDSDITIGDATVIIELDSDNVLKSIKVVYDMTISTLEYQATITISPSKS